MIVRPKHFQLLPKPITKGLVFAGLGCGPGGVTMRDSSLGKNNGTLTNMSPSEDWVWVPELGRAGIEINGGTQYVSAGGVVGSDTWTQSVWVRMMASANYHHGSGIGGTDSYIGLASGWDGAVKMRAVASVKDVSCTIWRECGYTVDWVVGEWYHVACRFTFGSKIELFFGGSHLATFAFPTYYGYAANNGLIVGHDYGANTTPTNSQLSDSLRFNRLLTDTEIADLADPRNIDLNHSLDWGQTRRTISLPPSSSPATFNPAWAARRHQTIGGGLV